MIGAMASTSAWRGAGVRIGFGSHGRVLREIEFGKEAFQYTPIHVPVRQNLEAIRDGLFDNCQL